MKKRSFAVTFFFALALTGSVYGLSHSADAQDTGKGKESDKGAKVKVIKEKGPEGHQTIGIDEDSVAVDSHKDVPLTFRTLMTWKYDGESNPPPPDHIKRLNDRKVRLIGFMYPLQEGDSIRFFCLLRTTQTCCYGPRPQYNQYVLVEMEEPTRFRRLDPVSCTGRFKVEPTPEEGFIFRMEGLECEPVAR